MSRKTPQINWKPLSTDALAKLLDDTPFNRIMLKLVSEEKVRAWLDDEGVIRYQHKPEFLRKGGR